MGYIYVRGALACDGCGATEGVRKRTCTARVTYPQEGGRSLPYCPPPALCQSCFTKAGGNRGLHGDCKEAARRATEENQQIAERIASGDSQVMAAWGSWHDKVPAGMVGVMFAPNRGDRWHEKTYRLVPKPDYDSTTKQFLSDYPNAQPWSDPDQD